MWGYQRASNPRWKKCSATKGLTNRTVPGVTCHSKRSENSRPRSMPGEGDAVDGERQREPAVRPGEGDALPLGAAHPLEEGVRAEQHVKIAGAGAHEGDVVGKPGRKPRRIHLDRKVVG